MRALLAVVTNYRGSLVVNEEEETQDDGDDGRNVVGDEADKDDIEGGAPHSDGQEEEVAKKMEIDVSVPVIGETYTRVINSQVAIQTMNNIKPHSIILSPELALKRVETQLAVCILACKATH